MADDREKLLRIMDSLERDYRSGKLSAEKYSYFRSKYEDKLNSIDAMEATRRIRSMQGKPSTNKRKRRKPTSNKKKEEQDLVEKYIINPKKGDAKYNKKQKSSMDGGTFKLVLVLVLVVAFTAGIAYGIFSFDFDSVSNTDSVAIVKDTAFPEIKEVNLTKVVTNYTANYTNYNTTEEVVNYNETTVDQNQNQNQDQNQNQEQNQNNNIETTTDTSTNDNSNNDNAQSNTNDNQDSGNDNSQSDSGSSDQGSDDSSSDSQGN
jgi:hypothetical protein